MSKDDRVDVVVRCRNEMPHTRATLDMLQRQAYPTGKILFVDCGSTDGSREAAQQRVGFEIIDLDPSQYIPGRVLNMGMNRTESDVVAFINADAIPDDPSTLGALVAPLINDDSIAAGYGRQLARPSADRLTKMDYKRVFGSSTQVAMRRGRFFSMAGSAISRAVWTRLPFDEELRYSEDV
ncbi:MAG: glycosyltransferase family 2 protein, partial [Gammaproteobacteria bacterium]|nr:glycosyltransferase family 2 protein [Gammaproteobacteria bacterium]